MTSSGTHIPLFPLNIFLLPGEQLPLHIFEPRYRQLFEEAKNDELIFGLPFEIKDSKTTLVSQCRLLKVTKEYNSGECDVIVEAIAVAELVTFEKVFPGKLYPGGIIKERMDFNLDHHVSYRLIELFQEFYALKNGIEQPLNQTAHCRLEDIAAELNLSNEDKIKLLMTESHEQRERLLANNIRFLNLLFVQENSVERGINLN